MTTYEHVLHGCAPVPLAGYLKALGAFRLVAEQIDTKAHGFWRDERFVLRTQLTEDELIKFSAEKYEPSPIISPWNGRAGFLEGEDDESDRKSSAGSRPDSDAGEGEAEESDAKPSRKGAKLVRRYESAGDRFKKLRSAVEIYRSIDVIKELDKARVEAKPLQEKRRKKTQLSKIEKDRLKDLEGFIKRVRAAVIANLRSETPDWAVDWFDACQRITQERTVFPLFGSGGLDGSRDFGVNFGVALEGLFDFKTGKALENTIALIRESLGFEIVPSLGSGNLGQYEPAGVGENITAGFGGEQPFNPVDFIFLLEGAVLFSGATTRRLGSNETRLSFPFTVGAVTAGSGAAASTDDKNFAEFWAPDLDTPCMPG